VNRFWWATHVTHHNQYNLSVLLDWDGHNTLRLSSFILSLLMGFDPVLFLYVIKLIFLDSYRYIRKLPAPIEYIFVTPSHHRVHHSSNDKYLDKNFQHLSFGIECLALSIRGRETSVRHYNPN
jgi:sterol desaturase/sphingolipid hydroxylase (fatty acid hydroxylase superfamily)